MSRRPPEWDEQGPERLYVITGGRSDPPAETRLDLVTLVVARSAPQVGMQPEHAAILRVCTSPLSVAEISAHLDLPVSVVTVLLADLMAEERIETRAPLAARSDIETIEAVIHGLRNL